MLYPLSYEGGPWQDSDPALWPRTGPADTLGRGMADPSHDLVPVLQSAFAQVTGLPAADIDPVIRPSDHADLQVNGALALAKRAGAAPRQIAQAVVDSGALHAAADAVEVAGPGFINVTLRQQYLADLLVEAAGDPRLGVRPAEHTERVLVDYSAPNIAKEMHAGHLRSTVIGDALVRLLSFQGHDVIRENHIGDWGTPFGMLIEHLVDEGGLEAADTMEVHDLDAFYKAARHKFDADDAFKERARQRVTLLQGRDDPPTMALWKALVAQSMVHYNDVYGKLGVLLTDADMAGESAYQDGMATVLPRLADAGILDHSDGADVVWVPGYTNRDGDPLPMIVRTRTGGFPYATSDLACVIDRTERLGADLLLYVVGTPQAQHLAMVYQVASMAGFLVPPARAVHVNFGSVLGDDRKMLKSRSGDPVRFADLVNEAIARGTAAVASRSAELSEAEVDALGHDIGVGALKYAELSTDRIKDYVFDWERMLAFEGNTGPYLMYAHARICSIFRRAGLQRSEAAGVVPLIAEPDERALALKLLEFDTAVHATLDTYSPHKLCTYLYELAQAFTGFYERCPILRAPEPVRTSRLFLADLTARVIAQGLSLLGIAAPERM